ncbi:MAG: spermine synthase [Candidatus Omnitrophica bacterium]|nr:spermine synthase [Candidatus Omnitrophota bacterium]
MFIFAILTVGFSGLIAQVVLLRELLIAFHGNELTVGIILANWVILEAAGALLLGKAADRIKRKLFAFGLINIIFIFSFILSLYLARVFKAIFHIPPGLGLGINHILWLSFLILLPVGFTHGGLFSVCAKIYASSNKCDGSLAIGRVYFWETAGTILAGVIFTYLFIRFFDSFQTVFIVLSLNLIMLCFLLFFVVNARGLAKFLLPASIILLLFLSAPVSGWLENSSIKLQWKNQQILDYANSIYGNVVVVKQQEQYTFFHDGLPLITSPHPDIIFIREFAGIPLLFHNNPRRVLIISGGAGGMINEILNNPGIIKVDYIELDPLILKMVKKYPTQLTERELNSKRVNVLNSDGRFFIKNTDSKYDLIFIGLSLPSDLQTNRFFTEEFFQEAAKRLNPDGILTFTLPGSLVYLSQDLKDLNASVLNSLKNVYPYQRVIPGDFNLFLASDSSGIMKVDNQLISRRLSERKIRTDLFLADYVEYRFHPRWRDWFDSSLKDATKKPNRDFAAFALFKTLSLWNSQFSPGWRKLFLGLEKVNLGWILGCCVVFLFISLVLFKGQRRLRFSLPYSIVSTGFFGMLLNLIIIFSFQVVYGYLYYSIAMLISLFMAGAALGSFLISRYLNRIRQPLSLLVALEIGIITWIFLTLFILLSYPPRIIFFMLCAVTGLWVGMEFPLANKIYLRGQRTIGWTAGIFYAADLFGGWLAAILSGILFLPILGVVDTCLVVFMFKLISLVFLFSAFPSGPRLKDLKSQLDKI